MDNENIYDVAYSETEINDDGDQGTNFNEEPKKKKRKKNRNGMSKYISIAIICSLCGGVVG